MGVGLGAAKWGEAVLVVSLVLPAATKQWSDNQQQRQLKTEVTTKLAGAVARATTDSGFLLANRIAGAQSDAGIRAAYQDALVSWKSEASAIEAQLAGYFSKTPNPNKDSLVNAMRAYSRAVQVYLGYCLSYERSGARVDFLERFTDNMDKMREQTGARRSAVIPPLVSKPEGADWLPSPEFKEAAQNTWAENIVNASAPLITMINQRQARGFQVGARAFIRQILQPIG